VVAGTSADHSTVVLFVPFLIIKHSFIQNLTTCTKVEIDSVCDSCRLVELAIVEACNLGNKRVIPFGSINTSLGRLPNTRRVVSR
jgi:hypothetical protein